MNEERGVLRALGAELEALAATLGPDAEEAALSHVALKLHRDLVQITRVLRLHISRIA